MSRVMIVEPLPLLRLAIGQVLQRLGHQLVAEVDNGQDALLHARGDAPQLVVLELAISGLGGLDLIRRLKLRDPALQLLVYTGQSSSHFARLCVQAGADGFVSKHDEPLELERALSAVAHGRRYFPRDALKAPAPVGGKELDTLSARELTVLQLISEGRSNQAIAEQLSISYKTVSTYKTRLQEKLQVNSRLALATIAQRNGIGQSAAAPPAEPEQSPEALDDPIQQTFLRTLLDTSPNPMFVRDREGRLLMCNQSFLALHHTSRERVLGERLTDAFWYTAEQGRKYQAHYDELVEKGETVSSQATLEFLGEPHHVQFWAEPWRDAKGTVLGMVGGLEDVTDWQILLGQLRDAHEQAQARYREVTRFARVVHEELNDPLQRLRSSLGPANLADSGQVALQRLSQRLDQLDQLLNLDQLRPPLVPLQLDIVQWITARLAAFNAQLPNAAVLPTLALEGVTARQLWVDGERLGMLFDSLIQHLSEEAVQAPLRISLATRMQVNGVVTLNLAVTLCQPLAHRQGIALQLCRNLTQSMEGSFRVVHENGETAFLIELECPAALPG
ncbi:LuxR C-terminal-related transcriptional regulator [Pseudomonas putida]|uniref:LuxR C-terminal-related transcriptional regulator n=1 Tax=Pseudomonas putida TaxID=303 RepID=UPI002365D95E|nr:LuxR C-terminal-related transcriptional regulator [Pseudomonas putida]MDD2046635.1 LuxR C-terminal-related transcriptional regulator [Pseudomonas putida]